MRALNLLGQKIGRLAVISPMNMRDRYGNIYWLCRCDCGKLISARAAHLKGRFVKSCGCLRLEMFGTGLSNLKHGDDKRGQVSRLYRVWETMKSRCSNHSHISFKHYGARGIRVCEDWKNDFLTFKTWALNHGYKGGLTLDRIDNSLGYFPDNCRWITRQENAQRAQKYRWSKVHQEGASI